MYLYVNRIRKYLGKAVEDLKEDFIAAKRLFSKPSNIALLLMVFLTFHVLLNSCGFVLSLIPEPDYSLADSNKYSEEYLNEMKIIQRVTELADEPRANPYRAYLRHLFGNRGYNPEEAEDLETKLASFPSISWQGPRDYYVYKLSDEEVKCLQKLIYAEARGEALEGQVSVGAVALNRWTSTDSRYPEFKNKTFIETCTSLNQFANIDGITDKMIANSTAVEAAQLAMRGWDPTRKVFPNGAKFFYNPDSPDISEYQLSIRQGVESLTIGNHIFHDDFNK